jgi:drug/metabolite transporter (DMT)-like permease
MYVAVLSSLIMPVSCLTYGILVKHALITKGVTPSDFTFAYFLLMYGFASVCGLIHFRSDPGTFNMDFFVRGAIGSAINVFGQLLMNNAVSQGIPLAPLFALQMTQSLFIMTYDSVVRLHLPNLMQAVGFGCGIVGVLFLVLPDSIKRNALPRLTVRGSQFKW